MQHHPPVANKISFDERALRLALVDANIRSLSALARLAGLSDGYVRSCAHGRAPGQHARARLAGVLGEETIGRIWPAISGAA